MSPPPWAIPPISPHKCPSPCVRWANVPLQSIPINPPAKLPQNSPLIFPLEICPIFPCPISAPKIAPHSLRRWATALDPVVPWVTALFIPHSRPLLIVSCPHPPSSRHINTYNKVKQPYPIQPQQNQPFSHKRCSFIKNRKNLSCTMCAGGLMCYQLTAALR